MEKRFRASIYLDVGIKFDINEFNEMSHPEMVEKLRERAREQVQAIVEAISHQEIAFEFAPDVYNPYLGGIAVYDPGNLLKPLDREI